MALRVAVLLSGSGTTLQNLIDQVKAETLHAEIVCVVGSREKAFGLERARNHGIPAVAVTPKSFADNGAFNAALWDAVRRYEPELVVLAGFMSLLTVPEDFRHRIMNVHPALIPAFCGKGMYGHHVHEAALEYGVKLSGCTVHFADNQYDHGPVILQRAVPVDTDDTPETLAARVFEAECEAYPEALRLIAEGRVMVEGRRVRIAT